MDDLKCYISNDINTISNHINVNRNINVLNLIKYGCLRKNLRIVYLKLYVQAIRYWKLSSLTRAIRIMKIISTIDYFHF